MADPALHQAIASAGRRLLTDLDAGRWPEFEAYLAEFDPSLADYPPEDDVEANAVWNLVAAVSEQLWTGSPVVDRFSDCTRFGWEHFGASELRPGRFRIGIAYEMGGEYSVAEGEEAVLLLEPDEEQEFVTEFPSIWHVLCGALEPLGLNESVAGSAATE